jgi:hypothetical protein
MPRGLAIGEHVSPPPGICLGFLFFRVLAVDINGKIIVGFRPRVFGELLLIKK